MASSLLSPIEAAKSKSDFARTPASRRTGAGAIPDISHFLGAAGNMAIQRAASGPLAHNPAAPAILGSANMSGGGCSCGGTCDECKKKQVQRKGEGGVATLPSAFEGDLLRSGAGAPLGPHTRNIMESRFGDRFDDVRVHDDSSAADAARDISAHAFTMGRDVYFGAGRYQPHTTGGQKLLAHELTHVLQQRRGVVAGGMKSLNATSHDDPFEQEAEQVERHFDRHEHTAVPAVGGTHKPGRGHSSHFGGGSIQKKCACGGTCSECSGQSSQAVSSTELKKTPLQRKADDVPSMKGTAPPNKQEDTTEQGPSNERKIQPKYACG
jgi:hypothetical protein